MSAVREEKRSLRGSLITKLALIAVAGLVFAAAVNLWASIPVVNSLASLGLDARQQEVLGESRLQLAEFHKLRREYIASQLTACWQTKTLERCHINVAGTDPVAVLKQPGAVSSVDNGEITWTGESHVTLVADGSAWTASFDFKPLRPLVGEIATILAAHDHLSLVIDGIKKSLSLTLVGASAAGVALCLWLIWVLSRSTRRQYRAIRGYIRELAGGGLHPVPAVLQDDGELSVLAREVHGMGRQLADAQQKVIEAERMSVWQTMARKVAHEIKNPLTPIALVGEQLQVIARQVAEGQVRTSLLESSRVISEEAASLNRMVKEFTSFARLPKPQRVATDLNQVVQDFVGRNTKADGPIMQFAAFERTAPVEADASMIHQILHNLANNARLAKVPEQVTLQLKLTRDADTWILDVADNGPGVPESLRDRMFDAYVTSRNTGDQEKGMGLGLTISRQIAWDHGGDLRLYESTRAGTTMRLSIPVSGSKATHDEKRLVRKEAAS